MAANTRIGWIGTGRMGYAMAARLAKQGAEECIPTMPLPAESRFQFTPPPGVETVEGELGP